MKAAGGYRVFEGLAFLSGVCALGYEVLYLRHLTTFLGDALWVHAALLSTFLAGVALGARFAHRAHRRLAALEIAVGSYAIALPWITSSAEAMGLFGVAAGSGLYSVLVTGALVAAPASLIGFSLPLFSAYLKERRESEGQAFAPIYALYNLGAALGVLIVEMLLVRTLGVAWSLTLLGVANLTIGVALTWAGASRITRPDAPRTEYRGRTVRALVLASVGSAVFQMFFLKSMYLTFSPHRENFAVGLMVILSGISVGAAVATWKRVRFETCVALVPLAVAISFVAQPLVSEWFAQKAGATNGSALGLFALKVLGGSVLAFLPMALYGALIPALIRQERQVAEESGYLLWVSGSANAVGYLLFVVLLYPLMPGSGVLVVVGALALAASLVHGGAGRAAPALIALGLVSIGVTTVTWNEDRFQLGAQWEGVGEGDDVTVFKWGGESAVMVSAASATWVSYNGHPSILVAREGIVNQAESWSGVIPALRAPRTGNALVLGLGTGITAGHAAASFDSVDVAEINGAFLALAEQIPWANRGVMDRPDANVVLADGRSVLRQSEGVYDAVINSIPAPTYYSASKIYTIEFYEQVRRALRPDGIFATWLSPTEMTSEGVHTVLAAIRTVFDSCDLWLLSSRYYMTTCSNSPRSPRRLDEVETDPLLRSMLADGLAGLSADEIAEDRRLSDDIFAAYVPREGPLNTDDLPILEFQVSVGEEDGVDEILRNRDVFGIEAVDVPSGSVDPVGRLGRRAAFFRRTDPGIFASDFAPLLDADSVLASAYRQALVGR